MSTLSERSHTQNAHHSTKLLAQTTLRNVLGTKTLSEILTEREVISASMQQILDDATEQWGIKVERVEMYVPDAARPPPSPAISLPTSTTPRLGPPPAPEPIHLDSFHTLFIGSCFRSACMLLPIRLIINNVSVSFRIVICDTSSRVRRLQSGHSYASKSEVLVQFLQRSHRTRLCTNQ